MGSLFRIPITSMKTFLLSLTLVLLTLQGSKAGNVTSCLTCNTPTAGCAEGTGTGKACARTAEGCYVLASTTEVEEQTVTVWSRGCCNGNSSTITACSEIHESQDVGGISTRLDQSWCETNDCNTMDPRSSSAGALVPALTLLMAAVAVITTNL